MPKGTLKSPWGDKGDYVAPMPGLSGAGVVSRGTDPQVAFPGDAGLKALWNNQPVGTPGGEETANSISGLPSLPNRFEPGGEPRQPPDLTDRNPGTIDQR